MTSNQDNRNNNNEVFREMDTGEKILVRSKALRITSGKTREQALADLKIKISEKESLKVTMYRAKTQPILWWGLTIAASLIISVVYWQLIPYFSATRIMADKGAQTNYILPDGSEVNLNAESSISFNKSNFNTNRVLKLKGEAFFNVTKGTTFLVETPNGKITVLGTSFNVFSRKNSFKVTCVTEKVVVSSGGKDVIIEQGESAALTEGILSSYRESGIQFITGWMNGEFYFENTPLNLVFEEIERQFNVKFVTKIKERRFFTGSFTKEDPLDEALETICEPMNLEYAIIENKKITIRSRN